MIMPPPSLKTCIRYSYLHTPAFTGINIFVKLLKYVMHVSIMRVSHQVTVSEHLPAGSAVITVTATDCDFGENGKITYRVMSSTRGVFYIDPSNGKITAHLWLFITIF